MECNLPLFQNVISSYRLDFKPTPNDIRRRFGCWISKIAEMRYKEYGLLLYEILGNGDDGVKIEDWLKYADLGYHSKGL
jgi:hypothetical protein